MDIIKILRNRQFWAFFGTGLIVSVAYMDPGNWGTSIAAGAEFNYDLLWIVWLSSAMAMLFQYISGKIGIAGHSVAGLVGQEVKDKRAVFGYWLLAELSILATDLAEFLGIVVAINLLFGIPMLIGTFVAIADVLLLLLFTRDRFRALEYAFIFFVSIIGFSYVYELFITKPDLGLIALHSIKPILSADTILLAVGIIGATVMPHALFVHSWLDQKKMSEKMHVDKQTALGFHLVDNVGSLLIAGFINAAILIMAAAAFYGADLGVASIEDAYLTLTPLFGEMASVVFAVALLFAGISSSITGTLAGQSVLESLTDFKLSLTVRRIITRVVNVIPLLFAILLGIKPLDILVYSQVVLSLMIPLPLIPLIYYSSKKRIMGELVNQRLTTVVATIFAVVIFAFNIYLLYDVALGFF